MDDNLYQDDFEEFLQGQVKNHRMYPSDRVWRNIDKELHGDNNWPALTIAAFALLMATVGVCVHFSPKPNIFAIQPATSNGSAEAHSNDRVRNLSTAPYLNGTDNHPAHNKNWLASKATASNNLVVDVDNTPTATSSATIIELPVQNLQKSKADNSVKLLSQPLGKLITMRRSLVAGGPVSKPKVATATDANITALASLQPIQNDSILKNTSTASSTPQDRSELSDKNMVDEFLKQHKNDLALYTTTQIKSLKNRFSYLIYLAPSISYRKLTEDHSIEKGAAPGPVALNYVTDVNNVVRHKPGTGIEGGFSILYNLSDKLRIKSGLQFNVRQYDIEAYRTNLEPASISLVTNSGIETINTYSTYRTNNGYVSTQLVNRYFQVAVPVGLEWEVLGNQTIQWNVAGSLQPTYLINKNAYLLSTNYKNYTESRDMLKSWNINSNIETFISFKVGDFKWQLGPQIRYQHMPTFIREYPIKEHLLDYGFKIGLSKVIL